MGIQLLEDDPEPGVQSRKRSKCLSGEGGRPSFGFLHGDILPLEHGFYINHESSAKCPLWVFFRLAGSNTIHFEIPSSFYYYLGDVFFDLQDHSE